MYILVSFTYHALSLTQSCLDEHFSITEVGQEISFSQLIPLHQN